MNPSEGSGNRSPRKRKEQGLELNSRKKPPLAPQRYEIEPAPIHVETKDFKKVVTGMTSSCIPKSHFGLNTTSSLRERLGTSNYTMPPAPKFDFVLKTTDRGGSGLFLEKVGHLSTPLPSEMELAMKYFPNLSSDMYNIPSLPQENTFNEPGFGDTATDPSTEILGGCKYTAVPQLDLNPSGEIDDEEIDQLYRRFTEEFGMLSLDDVLHMPSSTSALQSFTRNSTALENYLLLSNNLGNPAPEMGPEKPPPSDPPCAVDVFPSIPILSSPSSNINLHIPRPSSSSVPLSIGNESSSAIPTCMADPIPSFSIGIGIGIGKEAYIHIPTFSSMDIPDVMQLSDPMHMHIPTPEPQLDLNPSAEIDDEEIDRLYRIFREEFGMLSPDVLHIQSPSSLQSFTRNTALENYLFLNNNLADLVPEMGTELPPYPPCVTDDMFPPIPISSSPSSNINMHIPTPLVSSVPLSIGNDDLPQDNTFIMPTDPTPVPPSASAGEIDDEEIDRLCKIFAEDFGIRSPDVLHMRQSLSSLQSYTRNTTLENYLFLDNNHSDPAPEMGPDLPPPWDPPVDMFTPIPISSSPSSNINMQIPWEPCIHIPTSSSMDIPDPMHMLIPTLLSDPHIPSLVGPSVHNIPTPPMHNQPGMPSQSSVSSSHETFDQVSKYIS